MDIKGILFSLLKPSAPSGSVNLPFQVDVNGPNTSISVSAPIFVGDSGSGGTAGLAPAPASGDAAAGKFLKADGTWEVSGPNFADGETVSGSGTAWTLAHTPNPAASLILVQRLPNFGGVVLFAGTDFTISGAAVTTTNSLSTGVLKAWYRY